MQRKSGYNNKSNNYYAKKCKKIAEITRPI